MPQRVLCEVCVDSVAGVRAAEAGGADRIELCAALEVGGLTPSIGTVRRARAGTRLPIFAMVRPRAGDFVVDGDDVAGMVEDIAALRAEGVDGLVFGVLTPGGAVDEAAVGRLIEAADGLPVTFHRAFDRAVDRTGAADALARLRVTRILTSGGAATAAAGAPAIRELVARLGDAVTLVAGGGVRAHNVAELVASTGVREVHLSAMRIVDGPAARRDAAVSFAAPGRADHQRRVTDAAEVRAVVAAIRG